MALFTDGEINTLQDLTRYESGLLSVAASEGIDAGAKMALAQDLVAAELFLYLVKQSNRYAGGAAVAVDNASVRRRLGVSDVVVTEPLKRWHALKSIELVYEDAYNNQLNDRYQGRWMLYKQRAQGAANELRRIGVGLAWDPITRAQEPLLLSIAGDQAANTFYVQMTWTNAAGQEGSASDVVALQTADGSQLLVSAPPAPANAAGWNVYAGLDPDAVSLQNAAPLSTGVDWLLPDAGIQYGRVPGTGQTPDRYVVEDHVMLRG